MMDIPWCQHTIDRFSTKQYQLSGINILNASIYISANNTITNSLWMINDVDVHRELKVALDNMLLLIHHRSTKWNSGISWKRQLSLSPEINNILYSSKKSDCFNTLSSLILCKLSWRLFLWNLTLWQNIFHQKVLFNFTRGDRFYGNSG